MSDLVQAQLSPVFTFQDYRIIWDRYFTLQISFVASCLDYNARTVELLRATVYVISEPTVSAERYWSNQLTALYVFLKKELKFQPLQANSEIIPSLM